MRDRYGVRMVFAASGLCRKVGLKLNLEVYATNDHDNGIKHLDWLA